MQDGLDEENMDESKRAKMESVVPSKVLHVRNLPPDATEPELFQMGSQYGTVMRVLLLAKTRQGFIQFANQSESSAMLEYASQVPILFRGKQIYVQYSNRPEISQAQTNLPTSAADEDAHCRILLLTISNVLYPITVDVLSQVFSGYGTIEKIVVFVKGAGMQALVQFSSAGEAQNAKRILDGQNIYSGCCHLQIQNSTLTNLTVKYNNDKTRDFTQNLPTGREEPPPAYPPAAAMMPPAQMYMGAAQVPTAANPAMMYHHPHPHAHPAIPVAAPQNRAPYHHVPPQQEQSPVVLVNHLDPARITLDILFNIFSTCGVVQRIKILFNKRDTALIQFISPEQADVARSALTGCPLHGRNILVSASKYMNLQGKTEGEGGAALFADYTTSTLHRFKGPNSRIQAAAPSPLLHVSNIAASASMEDVKAIFVPYEPVVDFKFIQPRTTPGAAPDRKMALVQLATAERAVEALANLHNAPIHDVRVRISFSNSNLSSRGRE